MSGAAARPRCERTWSSWSRLPPPMTVAAVFYQPARETARLPAWWSMAFRAPSGCESRILGEKTDRGRSEPTMPKQDVHAERAAKLVEALKRQREQATDYPSHVT